ncbi:hypothetical protein MNBD_ALPHA06-1550 [hydrothermal vent metagenome]|uniref:Uncharacterized protein n=1 Tax=hydrothermal vent metagenome TaxID=652676 RepID=A0A3B0RJM7_9ZZZZ
MGFLGHILVIYAIFASVSKIALAKGLRALDFDWFRMLDQYGTDTGWTLRYGILAIGMAMILLHKWQKKH